MAIDDNTLYGLTGAQVKKIVNEIKETESIVTEDDYDWPESNPDGVALWKREGLIHVPAGVRAYFCNWGYYETSDGAGDPHQGSILVLPAENNAVDRQIFILLPQWTSYVSEGNIKPVPGRFVITRHSDGELLQENYLLGTAQLVSVNSYADSLTKGTYAVPSMGAISRIFNNLDTPIVDHLMDNWNSVPGTVGMMKLDVHARDNPPTVRIMVCVKVDSTDPDNIIYTWIQAN